jgi:hypothetical protein
MRNSTIVFNAETRRGGQGLSQTLYSLETHRCEESQYHRKSRDLLTTLPSSGKEHPKKPAEDGKPSYESYHQRSVECSTIVRRNDGKPCNKQNSAVEIHDGWNARVPDVTIHCFCYCSGYPCRSEQSRDTF